MCDHTLHCERKDFCRYCLQAFNTEKKKHAQDCFKVDGKQMIKIPKKVNMLDSKIMKGK